MAAKLIGDTAPVVPSFLKVRIAPIGARNTTWAASGGATMRNFAKSGCTAAAEVARIPCPACRVAVVVAAAVVVTVVALVAAVAAAPAAVAVGTDAGMAVAGLTKAGRQSADNRKAGRAAAAGAWRERSAGVLQPAFVGGGAPPSSSSRTGARSATK